MQQLTLFLLLSVFTIALSITGEIQSCSGWKLNHLPEVKRFLKVPGHADSYEGLTINFISGRTPELFLKDDTGKVIEQINLSEYSTDQLHALMTEKGFQRKPQGAKSGI